MLRSRQVRPRKEFERTSRPEHANIPSVEPQLDVMEDSDARASMDGIDQSIIVGSHFRSFRTFRKTKLPTENNGVASRKASSRLILVSCVVLQTFKGE